MRVAYADPPYPGMSGFYIDHPDYGGEVDHDALVSQLLSDYDGFCLHTASVTLDVVLAAFPAPLRDLDCRVMAWVKPFASFKGNVPVAYAWEPVIVKECRKPVVKDAMVYRDWVAENITMKRGLVGVKPARVCRWLFEVMGCLPEDELDDLYPGSGAVTDAWNGWRNSPLSGKQATLFDEIVV